MQAAVIHRWGDASQLLCTEMPVPQPGPGEILVKTAFAALNPIDYKMRNGRFQWFMNRHFPKILGLEASGIVVQTGDEVKGFRVGDPVFVHPSKGFRLGCYAEYISVPQAETYLLPRDFDLKIGAALTVVPVTALQVLRDKAGLQPGQKILINGASGSVGLCAVQMARALGANVTGVCSTRNLERVRQFGAHQIVDYTQTDFTRLPAKYDVILDTVSSRSFGECRPVLAPSGRYIQLMLRPLDLIVQILRNPFSRQKSYTVLMKYNQADITQVVEQIQNGQLLLPVDRVFPLQDIQAAHTYLESGRAQGKVLLSM